MGNEAETQLEVVSSSSMLEQLRVQGIHTLLTLIALGPLRQSNGAVFGGQRSNHKGLQNIFKHLGEMDGIQTFYNHKTSF